MKEMMKQLVTALFAGLSMTLVLTAIAGVPNVSDIAEVAAELHPPMNEVQRELHPDAVKPSYNGMLESYYKHK